ncbi:MAG: response regulator [Candidatus Heimdallarchaeaceae archaeon]
MNEELVLIVDDDKALCETLSDILLDEGIQVLTAHSGEEAIKQSRITPPSIALIDINLPDMDGTQLFHKLKEDFPKIICIYITAFASLDNTLNAFKEKANGFFTKPLAIQDLILRIKSLSEKKRLERELIISESKYKKLAKDLNREVKKQAQELMKTQEKLVRQERLAIFGKLVGGIAHEFNNILSTIISATEVVLENEKNENSIEMLNIILAQSLKASNFIRKMFDFSRLNQIEPKIVDLETFFKEIQNVFDVSIHDNIKIDYEIESKKLLIDSYQLEQLLMNLIINSQNAMPDGGIIKISVSSVTEQNVSDFEFNRIKSGNYVHLQVEDNGIGMSKDVQKKLFEPFYTTRSVGKGAGLGLSQVYGIVRQYSGYVCIESDIGKGTRVHIYFPEYIEIEN